MIKNTEWGAVAYLSHSKYGINQNIGINNYRNNGKFMTGCGANPDTAASTTCTPYNTAVGMQASTTGNIYGVYDMSGGTWEFTAAYTANNYSSSGFDANSIKGYDKYFDVYQNNSSTENHTGRILGDATGEIGPFVGKGESSQGWYADRAVFDTTHWFVRGGYANDTNRAGIFAYSTANGGPTSTIHSSRVILTPK